MRVCPARDFAIALFLLLIALPRPAMAERVVVPVDVGVGPAGNWFTGAIGRDQLAHTGIKISLAAVLNRAFIQRYLHKVPVKYRAYASRLDEFRYKPSIFIPDSLLISPKIGRLGVYGVTWRPFAIVLPLVKRQTRVDLSAGANLTYAFLHGEAIPASPLQFLRPGIDLTLKWEAPLTPAWLVSLGWASHLYVPQKLDGGLLAVGGFDDASLWHVGQVFLMLHHRFGYATDL